MTMHYATQDLRNACEADANILNKLTVVRTDGPAYGTPGPSALDAQARHAHVYADIGVAWRYAGTPLGSDQFILALGRKNDKAAQGNSGYKWSATGRI
jgi:hypothetical protein